MEVLLENNKYVDFLIEFDNDNFDTSISFTVYEVTSWTTDYKTSDKEVYLTGSIKWDGCSNISFGEDGSLHLCGKSYFSKHKQVMDAIWDLASKKIKGWNNEVAQ